MNIVVLASRDPNDQDYWSGTPRSLVLALRRGGHEVKTIGPLAPVLTRRARLKSWIYRYAMGKTYIAIRDPALMRARAAHANELLREGPPPDAVIAVHPTDAAFLQSPAPLVVMHDATWLQLLDFYPFYQRHLVAPETITGGYDLDRRALRNCDLAVYSSEWAANSIVGDYRIDARKVVVHPFGANLASVPSTDEVTQWIGRRGHGPCRLLFVGVDWHRKGGDVAVAVAQQLHARGVPVELRVVGCSVPVGVPAFVRGFGFLSKKDPVQARRLEQLFAEADFFLLPSRADCSPIVLNEAAASGLPVITNSVGAIAEIVRDGIWGMVLASGTSPDDYARRIQSNWEDRVAYVRMAWAARKEFDERLNWDAFSAALVASIRMTSARSQSSVAAYLGPRATGLFEADPVSSARCGDPA